MSDFSELCSLITYSTFARSGCSVRRRSPGRTGAHRLQARLCPRPTRRKPNSRLQRKSGRSRRWLRLKQRRCQCHEQRGCRQGKPTGSSSHALIRMLLLVAFHCGKPSSCGVTPDIAQKHYGRWSSANKPHLESATIHLGRRCTAFDAQRPCLIFN